MKKDSEIEATESPFAVIPGEVKKAENTSAYVSVGTIVKKAERGHLGMIEWKILSIVNQYKFMTSRQINQILSFEELEFKTSQKLNRKLVQMTADNLLSRILFGTFEKESGYKVYGLDKNAKFLLEAREEKVNWKPTDNLKSIAYIKGKLAANQVIISMLEKVKNINIEQNKELLVSLNDILRPAAVVTIGDVQKSRILLESIRRHDEDRVIRRLKKYEQYFQNENNEYSKSEILIVCEDKLHMAETYKLIRTNNIVINTNIYFTYDLIQLEENLATTWFVFNEDNEKIELKRMKISLLDNNK